MAESGWNLLSVLGVAAVVQAVALLVWTRENARYFRSRHRSAPPPADFTPRVRLVMPCKGVEPSFDDTVNSLLTLDYPCYGVTFVVESADDPAYDRLIQLIGRGHQIQTRLVVAGPARDCGQKVHNLLAATAELDAGVEVLAFADSDAVPDAGWLRRLVGPLHDPRVGVATGYRWFVPDADNWPGIVLAALNATIAFDCGGHRRNEVWGGSWAVRRPTFDRLLNDGVWAGAVTEDAPVSQMVRRLGLRVAYEPTCLVASPVRCSWRWLWAFGRRQYAIMRVYSPAVWRLALASTVLAQGAFWGGLLVLALRGVGPALAALLIALYGLLAARAVVRQRAVAVRFPLQTAGPRQAAWLDVLAQPLLGLGHLLLLLASCGRVITWRGIRYRMHGPHRTEVLARGTDKMPKPLREAKLPDGTRVFCVRPYEVRVIHGEMPGYFRHGISVRDGDVVFDVGANIGLFGLWVRRLADVSVYSFEPIPAVFRALEANAGRFAADKWKVFNCGLGRRPGMATFGYHKHVTVWSSPYPDDSPAERDLLRTAALRNLAAYPRPVCWLRWLPGPLRRRLVDLALDRAFRFKPVACPLRTVSGILRDERVPRIDLLKVDVQRGEWDVFEGVEEDDWGKVRQVVAEVHDLHDRRVERIVGLLKRHGFHAVTVEQEPMLRGTDIYNLFARRTAKPRAVTPAARRTYAS